MLNGLGFLPNLDQPTQVSIGGFGCARSSEGVRCWHESGNNIISDPVPNDLKNPRYVAAGWGHACALTDDGVRCWGENNRGQAIVPSDLKNPIQIEAAGALTCALMSEEVPCWGSNKYGESAVPSDL